ncbi:MAG: HD domain-containing protein [Psychrobium sp.]|nr:HD domain-containing protein [Psychrobium sp.]
MFATVIFTLYGIEVCPVLASISPVNLLLPLMLMYPVRVLLIKQFFAKQSMSISTQFKLDLLLFVVTAILLTTFNIMTYDAPWHSSGKVLVGMSLLGLFVATDLALASERLRINDERFSGEFSSARFISFSQKFAAMAIFVVVAIGVVLFMVVSKDLTWLLEEATAYDPQTAKLIILAEIAIVVGIILAYTIRIILSYTGNLALYLGHETRVLDAVANGDLAQRVPVVSSDEFGQMAHGTNAMINSLLSYQNELKVTRDASILALASLAETRDNETGAHILRTQRYVKTLALQLRKHQDFSQQLDDETIELYYKSAPLHDVGKVGIVDSILLKPGKLTDDEFVIMKTHAQIGADALLVAEKQMGSNSFLRYAREIALSHHEKWDGSGYPNKLAGDDIPLSGRLMALADVYDALLSKRVYKPAFSHEQVKEIILKGRGSHFDPRIVEAFEACEMEFIAIAEDFKDGK